MRTVRSTEMRTVLFVRDGGRCQRCGKPLGAAWHADHVEPWTKGGKTELGNLQTLCPNCNLRKGDTGGIKPRKFWRDVRAVASSKVRDGGRSMTIQIECGAGKTSLVSAMSHDLSELGIVDGVVWLVPRTNLVRAAVKAMAPSSRYWDLLGLTTSQAKKFEINGLTAGNIPDPSRGSWGYAASYDAANACPLAHLEFLKNRRVLLVADEVQFCAVNQPYGRILEQFRDRAAFCLFMSGDFDREDGKRVACVEYEPKIADASDEVTEVEHVHLDVLYGLQDAIQERSILPVDFSYGSGSVAFHRAGERVEIALSEKGPNGRAAVWAALNSDYARHLLSECVTSWRAHRTTGELPARGARAANPKAQLMVVTASQPQAEEVTDFMVRDLGFDARDVALVISDNAEAGDLLQAYCEGRIPVAVTVAMAYVGTDAPNMTHLCVLTHYRSKSWLHQLFARVWRRSPGIEYEDDYCVAFCPDDERLVTVVDELRAAQQVGVLASEEPDEGDEPRADGASREAAPIVVERSALTELRHTFALGGSGGDVAVPRGAVVPDAGMTREVLRLQGYSDRQIAAMLGALNLEREADERPLFERLESLAGQLERYQRKTAFLLSQSSGRPPDFRKVNSELKVRMGGKERDRFTEADYTAALAVHAPQVRFQLLKNIND